MPLFRDLDPNARAEVSNELVRQDNFVRSIYLDAVRRGVTFLLILLLAGAALAAVEVERFPMPRWHAATLACFLVGLTLLGVYFIVEFLTLKRLLWSYGWVRHNVMSDQADTRLLFSPPQNMKGEWVQPTLAYCAFAMWVIGAVLIAAELHNAPVKTPVTGRSVVVASVATGQESKQTSLRVTVPAQQSVSVEAPADRLATAKASTTWGRADRIAMASMVAAIAQAIALVVTFYIMWVSSRRQLRAFVGPETFDLMEGNMLKPPQPARTNEPGAIVRIKNFGPTVAYRVRIVTRVAVIEPINEHTLVQQPLVDGFHSVLGPTVPSSSTAWLGRQLTPGEITDIQAGVKAIYVYGRVEYLDIFRKKRFTTYRLRYAGQFPTAAPVMMTFAAEGNDAS